MRISDWSSDVCSSDLNRFLHKRSQHEFAALHNSCCDAAFLTESHTFPPAWNASHVSLRRAMATSGYCLNALGHRAARPFGLRSEERRLGKEWVSTYRVGWAPYH